MKNLARTMLALAAVVAIAAPAIAGPPINTTLSISVSPNSVPAGGAAVVTVTLTPDTGTINCGKGSIQYMVWDDLGVEVTGWLNLATNITVTANRFSAPFDASAIAVLAEGYKVSFRAGYVSSGPGCDFEVNALGGSPTVDLTILAAGVCPGGQTTGVFISIVDGTGNGTPPPNYDGTWSFKVRVQACEALWNVTAQGGSNGWTDNTKTTFIASTGASSADILLKNRNAVLRWRIGSMTLGQTEELTVQVEGHIKNSQGECGVIKKLNGDWSATYTNADGLRYQSANTTYTSTIEVTCP
jgi:hypothetical protein